MWISVIFERNKYDSCLDLSKNLESKNLEKCIPLVLQGVLFVDITVNF